MHRLLYLRAEAAEKMFSDIGKNMPRYENGNFDDLMGGGRTGEVGEVSFDKGLLEHLDPKLRGSEESQNAMLAHRALRNLSPRLASREGVWTYLTHGPCLPYARKRWLYERRGRKVGGKGKSKEEEERKRLVRNVEFHFFARGGIREFRYNALASLWWSAHIAGRCGSVGKEKALEILFYDANLRNNITFRTSAFRNPEVLSATMAVLEKWYDDEDRRRRFIRRRSKKPQVSAAHWWLQKINFVGGRRFIEALSADELEKLFSVLANEAEKEFREKHGAPE